MNGKSVPTRQGGSPVLRLTAIRDGRVDLAERKPGAWSESEAAPYAVREGDVLVTRGNGSLSLVGRAALTGQVTEPVAFPDTLIRVRPAPKVLDPKYLTLLWNSDVVRRQLEAVARTTAGIYKVNQKHLETVSLLVPPLEQQLRIVDILEDHLSRLDAADDYLAANRCRVTLLSEQSIVQALLGRSDGEFEVGGSSISDYSPQDGFLVDLPEGWAWKRLGDLADVVGGVTKDAKRQEDPSFVEVPYLRVANVQRGRLDLSDITRIRVPPAKVEALRLQPGDVLLNEGGDRDKLARGWVWEGQIPGCIHQNHVFRARIRDALIEPRLLSWAANTIGGKWAERNGKQSVNLASISLSKVRQMPVPVPPRGVQPRLVESIQTTLDAVSRLEGVVQDQARRSAGLRRSLLAAAFSGRLTGRASDMDRVEELAAVGTGS